MEPAPEPPALDGFEHQETLGSGGFADVYRYRQRFPRRSVAVKVLRATTVDRAARHQFIAEANTMAQLSNHPAIATIFSAGVTDDDRPYLVMEYCSRGSLATTYRLNPLPVDQVLRIGVRIASALESAHRLGIVHRDVKPANLLITDYGAAVLSDFGISAGDAQLAEVTMLRTERTSISTLSGDSTTLGLSVPWAPPEALDDEPEIDARSDVYSLAATLFTLIEGRSPYENPGGSNGALHLSRRIERGALVPSERVDRVPELSALLRRALSVAPADRPQTALAFAEQLGAVERSLGHEPTPVELLGDGLPPEIDADQDATVLRDRIERDRIEREHETRPRPDKSPVVNSERPRRRWMWIAAAALGIVVIAGGGTAVGLQMSSSGSPVSERTRTPSAAPTEDPAPSETPEPPASAVEAIPKCPDAYIEEYYALFVTGGDPADEPAIDDLHEPAILDAGISPYCGFGWHEGSENVLFEGTNAQAAQVSDALRSAGYACSGIDGYGDDAYFECLQDTRRITIKTEGITPNAYDKLPIKHAFEVDSYRAEPCGDEPNSYCVLPW